MFYYLFFLCLFHIQNHECSKKEIDKFFNKKISENTYHFFESRYLSYKNGKTLFFFDLKNEKFFNFFCNHDIEAYCFDGNNFYIKHDNFLKIFDLKGTLRFQSKDLGFFCAKKIFVDKKNIYIISHDNIIFCFNEKADLIWFNEDFYSNYPYFSFCFKYNSDYLFGLLNQKIHIIHKNSGKSIKTIMLDEFFDNMDIKKDKLFLYSRCRYLTINLKNFKIKKSSAFFLNGNKYIESINTLKSKEGIFDYVYINTFFSGNKMISFNSLYNSNALLIKDKIQIFNFKNFTITHIFDMGENFLVLDSKNGTFKIL